MTEIQHKDRVPFIAAIVAAMVVLAVGGYLFSRSEPAKSAEPDITATAGLDANSAMKLAGMTDEDRKATEAVVRAYILEHPEIITEAVTILQQRQVAERLKASADGMAKPFYSAEAGNPKGDVTVVEFTDYNCGFCRSSVADVERLLADDGDIRLVYRELPILSATSREAALWALAAAKQGKHKVFHAAMFSGGRPDATTIKAAASRAGLNLAVAEKFAASREAAAEVDGNLAMMQQVGFNGTPTFIIGDQILEGALGYEALKAAVAKAREQG